MQIWPTFSELEIVNKQRKRLSSCSAHTIKMHLHGVCIWHALFVCSKPIQSNSTPSMWVFLHLLKMLLNPIDSIYCSNFDPILVHKTFSECICAHKMNGPFTHFNSVKGDISVCDRVEIVAALAALPLCPCLWWWVVFLRMEQHIFVILFANIFYITHGATRHCAAAATAAHPPARTLHSPLMYNRREKK